MRRCANSSATVSDVPESAALAELLADDCARDILVETKGEACSAAELSDRTGHSKPTVYRRLDRLREFDLVDEKLRPVTDGRNYSVYRATLEGVHLDLTEGGFEVTVSRRERMTDRFARFVEGT